MRMFSLSTILSFVSLEFELSSYDETSALHFAAMIGHYRIAKLLIENGCGVDLSNVDHFTPMHLAALHGRVKVVRLLLQNGYTFANLDSL